MQPSHVAKPSSQAAPLQPDRSRSTSNFCDRSRRLKISVVLDQSCHSQIGAITFGLQIFPINLVDDASRSASATHRSHSQAKFSRSASATLRGRPHPPPVTAAPDRFRRCRHFPALDQLRLATTLIAQTRLAKQTPIRSDQLQPSRSNSDVDEPSRPIT